MRRSMKKEREKKLLTASKLKKRQIDRERGERERKRKWHDQKVKSEIRGRKYNKKYMWVRERDRDRDY